METIVYVRIESDYQLYIDYRGNLVHFLMTWIHY